MSEDKEVQMDKCTLCIKCQFYIKESDTCMVREGETCSEQDRSNCTDFLMNDKLVFF